MENLKSKIIPYDMKINIDEILEQQLFNSNRYYAESNPNISALMDKELYNTPEKFLERLSARWNWHNLYYESLMEPAYKSLIKDNQKELSPKEIDDLINVYSTSCLIDEATLVMSGAIKKYLNHSIKKISIWDENLSTMEASKMLITPPVETFFAQYRIDHLYYINLLKTSSTNLGEFKKYLLAKYHADDEVIFNSRLKKDFKNNFNMSSIELSKMIERYKISSEYKINHFYFTLEHSDRKAIRDIITYDNLNEKLIACNLIGISGFLLRTKILEYLNSSKILPNNGYIYEFSNNKIIKSLESLKDIRKKSMDKDIHPYKQRGDTCAIVCMMMALEYYDIIGKANWYDERRYYRIYGSRYMSGTPFSALAYHFSKNGLNTTIYHSEKNLFNNDKGMLSNEDFKFSLDEYKEHLNRAKSTGTKIINGIEIDSQLLRRKLEEGNLVILAGEVPGGYHAILLSGYKNNTFIVCDPQYKNKQVKTEKEIDTFMNTSIGKWFITVNDNTKEKDNLINNLNKFSTEAIELMNHQDKKETYNEKKKLFTL